MIAVLRDAMHDLDTRLPGLAAELGGLLARGLLEGRDNPSKTDNQRAGEICTEVAGLLEAAAAEWRWNSHLFTEGS
ncbi:hypothetical protein [Lentzea sp. NPDC051838]|uniref:hypothetical protein n=1 Tax=Lentzea sp. NPDC051838 TaxID=3154849 RepID=UPI00342E4EAB